MEALWRGIIQDMLEHMSPEEVTSSLSQRYPEHPRLLQLVQELAPARSDTSTTVLGFCKKAQMGSGFGYGNEGQTNFSVPNSEGEQGDGNPVDNTSDSTPSSSYTDRLKNRVKVRREEEEEEERQEKRRELLKKLRKGQTEPGSLLKNKKNAPTQQTGTPSPAPESAEQWSEVGTEMEETTNKSKDTEQQSDKVKKVTKEVADELKNQADEAKDTTDDLDEYSDSVEKATDTSEDLRKSLEDLVR